MFRTLEILVSSRFFILASLVGLTTALTSPFISIFITKAAGAGPSRLALFLLLTSVSALFLSMICGRLADSGARGRTLLLTGASAGCFGYLLFAAVRGYWVLLLISATFAALSSTLIPQIFTYAREAMQHTNPQRAPSALTSLRMLFSAAWVVGPPAGAAILGLAGFTGLFAAVAMVYCLVIVTSIGFPVGEPEDHRSPRLRPSAGMRAEVMMAAAAFIAFQTASAIGVLALPLLITRELAATTGAVGLVVGLAAGLEVPLMILFARIAMRAGARPLLCLGAAAGAGYYTAVASAAHVWQVAAAQFFSAVFVSAVMGLGIGFFQDIRPDRIGSATALYSNTGRISTMIAGPVVGFGQQFGNRSIFLTAAALCVIGLGLLVITSLRQKSAPRAGSRTDARGALTSAADQWSDK